ncbi:16S rRNA (uracil(1498)-N(3))-methyltransferase [Undibacter mobilis]|uniref:Ribosomal RNA small subunit methyltransferase E n=1 Tax=Undibacter mobilis TaxID=2292256 RepID=A0A371BBD0_9BRAD|nr:16S rRNA (uracil(1498)-N(3))-methyltransferase [Undibacter mobilis]RDV04862.1 16S rRNA (uracil(1498)-N(3))-methyltransferase [Undibacter mobilis]
MPQYDFRTPRVYLDTALAAGAEIPLDRDQANHLGNVLRLAAGDAVLLFNGRDGEWGAELTGAGKRLAVRIDRQMRPQPEAPDLEFLFAPLKHARLDYTVQKAVELGVSRLRPVLTQHTQVTRINLERMRANVVEAAQQCGVLNLAEVAEPIQLKTVALHDPDRLLIFCDEDAEVADPVKALRRARPLPSALVPDEALAPMPMAVLIGPEGGFSEDERALLMQRPNIVRLSLGPLILRADTAAVAALTLAQAVLGNWRS